MFWLALILGTAALMGFSFWAIKAMMDSSCPACLLEEENVPLLPLVGLCFRCGGRFPTAGSSLLAKRRKQAAEPENEQREDEDEPEPPHFS